MKRTDLEVVAAWQRTGSMRAAARYTGRPLSTVRRIIARHGADEPQGQPLPPVELPEAEPFHPPAQALPIGSATQSVKGDAAGGQTVELVSDKLIRTLEDAVAFAEVDLSIWRVRDWECTAWQVGMKLNARDEKGRTLKETPVVKQLWRVRLRLERLAPKSLHDATEALIARLEAVAPVWPKLPAFKTLDAAHLWEIDLFDVHIGKLAWRAETGQDYDLAIARDVFKNAVADLIQRANGFPPERILLPVGNDFFQVDNLQSATTKGTRVDSDSRFAKIIEHGTDSMLDAVSMLAQVAPVYIMWVPGNHDRLASYHLCRELRATFRHEWRVAVDVSPNPRKYFQFGDNLIGFTHGDRERERSLPAIMLSEAADMIYRGQCREWHLGHQHRTKAWETVPVNEEDGVTVRRLASLSATDAWHHENGYVGNRRAAEVFIFGREPGLAGHFYVNARTGALPIGSATPRLCRPDAA